MKRFLFSMIVLLSALSVFAQNDKEAVRQKFFDAKIREFVYRLELSDEQKAQFVPIYKNYNEEIHAVNAGGTKKPKGKPATSEEAAAVAKARIEHQQQIQNIRLKYIDEFATVLDADQLNRLFKVEDQIQQKLMKRKNGKGKPDGNRPDGNNRQNQKNRPDFGNASDWE